MLGNRIFNKQEEQKITEAIQAAENRTSGEIRLHIDEYCKSDPQFKAANVFHNLKMDETALRNGVLIYLAIKEHKVAIIGDKGINEKVPKDFWQSTLDTMITSFKEGKMVEGLHAGITEAGTQLKKYFPVAEDDINELPDDISYGA